MRRPLITLLLLAIVGGIGWWLSHWGGLHREHTDSWRIMPPNAAVIIEVPSPLSAWERFKSTSQLWTSWAAYPACKSVDSIMVSMRSVLDGDGEASRVTDASTMLIAVTAAEDGFNVLLCWSFDDPRALEKLEAAYPDLRKGRIPYVIGQGLPSMESVLSNGALLLSTSSEELTDAMARFDGSSTGADSTLIAARRSLGEGGDAHVLLHTGRAQRLLSTWLHPEAMRSLEEIDGWAAVDVRARPEATLFSGLLFTPTTPSLLRATMEQGSSAPGLGRVLPAGIRSLWQVTVTDALRFSGAFAGEQEDPSLFEAYGAWAYGAIGIAGAGSEADSSSRYWAIMRTEDPLRASEALNTRCLNGCDTLAYRSVRMTRSADTSALAVVWGGAFDRFERPWWCLLNDKVVFSEQVNALREAIDAWTDGSSFQQDTRNGSFFRRYASDAAYTWWCDGSQGVNSLRPKMKDRGAEAYDEHRDGWQGLAGCLVQLVPESEGRFQLTACVASAGVAVGTQQAGSDGLWSVTIDAPINAGPYLLTDHLSRTKQILVQDRKHRIHLISCTGKVLWQRELDGPILGGVQQVDRYKNGKLQMLFNTAGRVYLIDRNGKDVEQFPIVLAEAASAPLNVFDYDGQKEYRMLLPTVEARLLNFDMNGKAVEGWVPPKTQNTCDVPVQHLRIRGKDYLVLVDHGGSTTVLDRRGVTRYTPKLTARGATRFIGLSPALEIDAVRLLWIDSTGNALSGALDGSVDTLAKAPEEGEPNGTRLLRVDDADHDGRDEVVLFAPEGSKPIEGAKPLFVDRSITADAIGTAIMDINLDGALDKVTVASDGRVFVTAVP